MNSHTVYTEPVNKIKQKILFDNQLDNISHICSNWNDFVTEISEWGIYTLAGVDFDILTDYDKMRLDAFILCQNGYEKEYNYA
tara:strand:+ start:107 stop:355 length:249 start_codon:yes stop_codon:yes gene_type:complete